MPSGLSFNFDGTIMATSTQGHSVTLWSVKDWRPIPPVLSGDTRAVSSVAFGPDGKVLVSGSADGDIRLWDMQTHELIGTLGVQTEAVNSVAFAPGKECWRPSARMIPSFYGTWISKAGSVAPVRSGIGTSRQRNGIHTLEPVRTERPVRIVKRRG